MIFKNEQLHKLLAKSSTGVLSSESKARVRASLMESISHIPQEEERAVSSWSFTFLKFGMVMVLAVMVLSGTAYASRGAQPGDILYPVKKVKENIAVTLAPTPEIKLELKTQFAEERLKELENIKKIPEANSSKNPTPQKNTKARIQAEAEVTAAIEDLKSTQEKLQTKVESRKEQTEKIEKTIMKLENNLDKSRKQDRDDKDTDRRKDNDDEKKDSRSSNSWFKSRNRR